MPEKMSLIPINVTVQDVLNALFNAEDTVCFRVFDDKKRGIFKGQNLECICSRYRDVMEKKLIEHNRAGHGIFFVVNYGGQTDEAVTRINAQFVESDELSFEEMEKRIQAFPLPPSMVIKTKKSLHTYWFMKDHPEVERFRTIQKQLVKYFDGDIKCQNESRVMRLPGFYHCKEEPILVECVLFHPERKYSQDELAEVLPKIEKGTQEKITGSEKGLPVVLRECEFIKYCQENAKRLSEHDWYAMITNLTPFEGGEQLIHELSRAYPKYSESETTEKINHFLKSGTRPITCKTIAEKGFQCPKLKSGECKCKAPAALCYKPVSNEELESLVASLPIKNQPLYDMKTASGFVEDYLYNQDIAIATSVIMHSLKDRFKFTAPDLRALMALYKSKRKGYMSGLSVRQHKTEDDSIPLWYEPTERGLKFKPMVLAKNLAVKEKMFYAAEQHYRFESGVYVPVSEMKAQRIVQDQMVESECKYAQIADAEKQWRMRIEKEIRELNANPYIINVKNGLYNVLENKLTGHMSDYRSTIQLNVRYDPEANCPLFKQFLVDSMEGDMEQVKLIQEMLGYFLVPITSAQKCFVIVGAAAAGKSVLLNVLGEILLGQKNVSNVSWQALNDRFKTAELFGKLANIFADLPTKNIDDNGIFKALVGEDFLTVEKKNKNPFSFQSAARLLFSCNSIPRNYGDKSEGFYRRLIIIRFNHTVPQEKRDADLLNKFRDEADGIFRFALEGLRLVMDHHWHFDETEKNRAELQRYREESDSVLSFIADCMEEKTDGVIGSMELFNHYKRYCEDAGMKPYAQNHFIKKLLEAVPSACKGKDSMGNRRVVRGIALTDD